MRLALVELNGRMTDKHRPKFGSWKTAERQPASRVLAVRCLGALDAVPQVLDALADESTTKLVEAYFACATGSTPRHAFQLLGEMLLEKRYTHPAEYDLALLHGSMKTTSPTETYAA